MRAEAEEDSPIRWPMGLIDLQENNSIVKIKILCSTLKIRWAAAAPFLPSMCVWNEVA